MTWPRDSKIPGEVTLQDGDAVVAGNAYVADGRVVIAASNGTVAGLKAAIGGATVVTTCAVKARGQVLPGRAGDPRRGPLLEDV